MSDPPGAPPRPERAAARLRDHNVITAIVVLLGSVGLLLAVPSQVAEPKMLFGQPLVGLDPKLFPRIGLGAIVCVSVWLLVRSLRVREGSTFASVGRAGLVNVAVTAIALLAYATLMEPLGFVPSSIAIIAFLATFFGNRNVLLTVVVAVSVPVTVYLLFTRTLLVSLPPANWF